jgi:hypothetical protein
VTRLRTVVLVAFAALLLAACGESRDVQDTAPATAATIEGLGAEPREIPRSEVEEVVSAVEGSEGFVAAVFQGSVPATFRQLILTQLIQIETIESLVQEKGAEVTQADRDDLGKALREELSGLLTQSGREADTDAIMGEIDPYAQLLIQRNSLLNALGRKLTEGQQPGSQEVVCARHILVDDEAVANDLLAQLRAGADFATLATANSTDTGSGANGGDLQCAPPGNYVPEFAQAIEAAPLNEVVGPVKTQFGFHLIKVYDRKTEEVPVDPRGPAGDAITERLQSIKVSVSPDLGSWDGSTLSVVQPAESAPPTTQPPAPPTSDTTVPSTTAPSTTAPSTTVPSPSSTEQAG